MRTAWTGSRLTAAVAGIALTAAVVLSGCSAGGGSESSAPAADTASGESRSGAEPGGAVPKPAEKKEPGSPEQPSVTREIIRTGFVTVEAENLEQKRQELTTVVTGLRGTIATEDSRTDDKGRMNRANLVVRVPTASFDAAMTRLTGLGKVKQVKQESSDVTEQVVDINSRITTQRASLTRMRALLAKAASISEIVSVEGELTRREADLESLLAKQKALAGQTELATITLTMTLPGEAPPPPSDPERGFLHGLSKGWDAFAATVSVALTALGALLPFLVLGLLVAAPVAYLVRRQRRTAQPVPATTPPAPPA